MAQAETRRLAAIMFTDMVGSPSVVYAVQCAQHVQTQFRAYNTEKETAEQIHVRIGIHLGDIVQRDGDVFGDGVNIASRLQALAEPDTICISHLVYQAVEKKLPLGTVVSLGRPRLKNIANFFLADVLGIAGRPAEGIEFVKKAMRLNPRYPVFYANTLGWSYLFLGRHEEAVAALKDAIARNPNFLPAHANLAATYSELGREAEARAEIAEVLRISPNLSLQVWRRLASFKDPVIVERLMTALRKAGMK